MDTKPACSTEAQELHVWTVPLDVSQRQLRSATAAQKVGMHHLALPQLMLVRPVWQAGPIQTGIPKRHAYLALLPRSRTPRRGLEPVTHALLALRHPWARWYSMTANPQSTERGPNANHAHRKQREI